MKLLEYCGDELEEYLEENGETVFLVISEDTYETLQNALIILDAFSEEHPSEFSTSTCLEFTAIMDSIDNARDLEFEDAE